MLQPWLENKHKKHAHNQEQAKFIADAIKDCATAATLNSCSIRKTLWLNHGGSS